MAILPLRSTRPGRVLRAPLVGRKRELETLLATLQAVDEQGRLLVIEGEPGIGKTRLATTVMDLALDQGATVLEARAYAGEEAIPLSVVAEVLRSGLALPDASARLAAIEPVALAELTRLLPVPGVPPTTRPLEGDPFGRVRLFEALGSVVVALVRGAVPGIVWIDDVHLADSSTIEFLGYLARRLRDHPLALMVTWRVEDLEPGVRERILEVATQMGLTARVQLDRLDRSDVATLADAVLGGPMSADRVDTLFEDSEGLPLYVVEALARPESTGASIPGGVNTLLRSRIATVSDVGRQVLAAAAVIGRSFDPGLVRAASGRSDDETVAGLEELSRRGLVREVGSAAPDDPASTSRTAASVTWPTTR